MIETPRSLGQAVLQTLLGAGFSVLALSAVALAQSGAGQAPYQPPNQPAPYHPGPAAGQPAANPPPQPSQQPQSPPASNQPPPNQAAANPICARLQGQLAAFDQGSADTARADQLNRAQDAIAKQQADLDRAVAQAHKSGCAGEGFFALFSALSPQCGPITSQIQQ